MLALTKIDRLQRLLRLPRQNRYDKSTCTCSPKMVSIHNRRMVHHVTWTSGFYTHAVRPKEELIVTQRAMEIALGICRC